jgi:dihydrolipoamide dehydrogenase
MDKRYDVVVLGGGPGGYAAAIRALQRGLSAAVVERSDMGGTCLNRGCIPTKSLLNSAQQYQAIKAAGRIGISTGAVEYDFSKMAARKDAAVKQLRSGVEYLISSNGGAIYRGEGYIKDRNTIEITGGETIHADKIIIATGSRPAVPPFITVDNKSILDSDGLLNINGCPQSVIIIGGGVIGIEFATLFAALEKRVTVIEMLESILPGTDPEVSSILKKNLERKGVKFYTGSRVTSLEAGEGVTCEFECQSGVVKAQAEIAAVVTGRKPNSENLGLENIRVQTERGFIRVNDRMETSVLGVYAVGDVTGKKMLAHVATAQGIAAAENAAGANKTVDSSLSPACIYSEPEIASVGLTEEEAVKNGFAVRVGRFPVSANGKSTVMGERSGIAKIIAQEGTDKILGAHIIAPRVTEMISEITLAMKCGLSVHDIADTIHPHPTVSEIIMEAAHDVYGMCIDMPKAKK